MTTDPQLAIIALDAIDIPVYVVDRDLRFVAANRAYRALCARSNLDPSAPVGFKFNELFPTITDEATANFRRAFDSGKEFSVETRFELNGRKIHAEIRVFPIITDGQVTHVAVATRDMTAQRTAQRAAQESYETARALMDASTAIMIYADNEGRILNCNEPAAKWFGQPIEKVIGGLGQEIAPPEWVAAVTPYFVEVLFSKAPARFQFVSGELMYDTTILPILDADNQVSRFAIFANDITQHSRVLAEIRQSEERFRLQFESIPVPTYIYELRGDDLFMVDYNPAAHEFTQGGVEQLRNLSARQLHIRNPQVFDDLYRCATEHVRINRQFVYEFQLTSRKTFLDVQYVPFSANRVLVHTVDLTESKRVEEQLRESRQAYRDLVENVNDVIYSVDDQGILTYVSPAVKRLLGYEPMDLIGQSVWKFIFPGDHSRVQKAFVDALNNVLYPSEYRLLDSSGESRWVQTSSKPIPGDNGAVGLRGVAVDITERRAAEEKLREAHHELEARVEERTRELARANEQLQIEQDTLQRKNLVLQELVEQIENSRHHAALQILANIERVVMPIIGHLEGHLDPRSEKYVALLKQTLTEITAPFAATLDTAYRRLTAVEIEICNLVRRGYGSKQIAELRHSSVQTVVKQRKIIRRKLGIDGDKVNLSHFLSRLGENRRPKD